MILFLILLLIPAASFARLNYIEAHLLRLSNYTDVHDWMSPSPALKSPRTFEFTTFGSGNKDVFSVYNDFKSKNQTRLTERLSKSYGHPYDLSARVGFAYHSGELTQVIATNGGAVLSVTDPVFPELRGMLFHDYSGITQYTWRGENFVVTPRLGYGFRKFIRDQYTVGDLVAKSVDVKFNKVPYIFFAELGASSAYRTPFGNIDFDVNSLPLRNSVSGYWDTYLGYSSPDFFEAKSTVLTAHVGYSPFYGGEYDVVRTIRTAVRGRWESFFGEAFTMDRFYPGARLGWEAGFARIALHTLERAYDNAGNQRSRQYGFELTAGF